jgi:uncharacterized delta-60 repeat protein
MKTKYATGLKSACARIERLENRMLLSGGLDPTYGVGGVASGPGSGTFDETVNSAVEPSGKYLIQSWQPYGALGTNQGQLILTQFTAAGQLDPTFGTDGSVYYDYHPTPTTTASTDDWDHSNQLLVQPDGKIISIRTATLGSLVRVLVMRLNTDGSIDTTFNSAPALNFTFGKLSNEQDWVAGAALQSDGKILVLVDSTNGIHSNIGVLRLDPNGSIDTTYGYHGGSLKLGVGSIEMGAALDSFGRLVVGYDVDGYGYNSSLPGKAQFGVYRLTTSGAIDQTFNGGKVADSPQVPYQLGTVGSLVIDSTGDILIDAGLNTDSNSMMTYAVARFTAFGKPDSSFGNKGVVIGPWVNADDPAIGAAYARIYGLAVQSDNKPLIVSLGSSISFGPNWFETVVTRLTTTGAIDTTFGTQGITNVPGDPSSIQFQSTSTGGYIYAAFGSADRTIPQAARFLADVTTPAPAELTGTVIGTSGSYRNQGNTIANVFDHNVDTFFDAPTASGAWVGLDLGSAQIVTQIQFVGRAGYESRMVGGEFQASNSANFSTGVVTLATIKTAPTPGAATVINLTGLSAFRYFRYIGPAGGSCNIAELEFLG